MDNPIAFDNIDVIINNGNIDSYLSEIGEFSIYSQPLDSQYEQLTGHFTAANDILLKLGEKVLTITANLPFKERSAIGADIIAYYKIKCGKYIDSIKEVLSSQIDESLQNLLSSFRDKILKDASILQDIYDHNITILNINKSKLPSRRKSLTYDSNVEGDIQHDTDDDEVDDVIELEDTDNHNVTESITREQSHLEDSNSESSNEHGYKVSDIPVILIEYIKNHELFITSEDKSLNNFNTVVEWLNMITPEFNLSPEDPDLMIKLHALAEDLTNNPRLVASEIAPVVTENLQSANIPSSSDPLSSDENSTSPTLILNSSESNSSQNSNEENNPPMDIVHTMYNHMNNGRDVLIDSDRHLHDFIDINNQNQQSARIIQRLDSDGNIAQFRQPFDPIIPVPGTTAMRQLRATSNPNIVLAVHSESSINQATSQQPMRLMSVSRTIEIPTIPNSIMNTIPISQNYDTVSSALIQNNQAMQPTISTAINTSSTSQYPSLPINTSYGSNGRQVSFDNNLVHSTSIGHQSRPTHISFAPRPSNDCLQNASASMQQSMPRNDSYIPPSFGNFSSAPNEANGMHNQPSGFNTQSTDYRNQSSGYNGQSTGSNSHFAGSNNQFTGHDGQASGSSNQFTDHNNQFSGANNYFSGHNNQSSGTNQQSFGNNQNANHQSFGFNQSFDSNYSFGTKNSQNSMGSNTSFHEDVPPPAPSTKIDDFNIPIMPEIEIPNNIDNSDKLSKVLANATTLLFAMKTLKTHAKPYQDIANMSFQQQTDILKDKSMMNNMFQNVLKALNDYQTSYGAAKSMITYLHFTFQQFLSNLIPSATNLLDIVSSLYDNSTTYFSKAKISSTQLTTFESNSMTWYDFNGVITLQSKTFYEFLTNFMQNCKTLRLSESSMRFMLKAHIKAPALYQVPDTITEVNDVLNHLKSVYGNYSNIVSQITDYQLTRQQVPNSLDDGPEQWKHTSAVAAEHVNLILKLDHLMKYDPAAIKYVMIPSILNLIVQRLPNRDQYAFSEIITQNPHYAYSQIRDKYFEYFTKGQKYSFKSVYPTPPPTPIQVDTKPIVQQPMQQAPKKKANYSSAPMTHYQNIAMAIAGNQNDCNFCQLLQSQGLGAKYFQNHIVDKTGFRSIANCPNYLILSAAERLKVLHEGKYCSKCLKPREASHQCNTSEHVKCKLCTMRVENCLPHMENNKDKLLRKQYFCNKNKYKFAMGPDDNVFFAQPQPDSQSN